MGASGFRTLDPVNKELIELYELRMRLATLVVPGTNKLTMDVTTCIPPVRRIKVGFEIHPCLSDPEGIS